MLQDKKNLLTALVIMSVMVVGASTVIVFADANDELEEHGHDPISVPSEIKEMAGAWYSGEVTDIEYLRSVEDLIVDGTLMVQGYNNIVRPTDDEGGDDELVDFTVITDKSKYNMGDNIIVSGTVPDVNDTGHITCIVKTLAMNYIVQCGQATAVNGNWQSTINTKMKDPYLVDGEWYVIEATYMYETIVSTQFQYVVLDDDESEE